MRSAWTSFPAAGQLLAFFRVFMVALCVCTVGANAQTKQDQPATEAQLEQSPKVKLLLNLIEDEDIQQWAKQQSEKSANQKKTDAAKIPTLVIADRLQAISHHVFGIFRTLPTLPEEISKLTQTTRVKTQGYGVPFIAMLAMIFMSGGYLAALAFRKATSGRRSEIDQAVISGPADRFHPPPGAPSPRPAPPSPPPAGPWDDGRQAPPYHRAGWLWPAAQLQAPYRCKR